MTNYDAKEEKALEKIADTIDKLDVTLEKFEDTDSRIKAWAEQRKAIFEIKKILHEAGKFEKYDQKEYDDFMDEFFG
ncbi:hypothetical protein ACYSNU_01095 [Enterococcus sp. LJL120]